MRAARREKQRPLLVALLAEVGEDQRAARAVQEHDLVQEEVADHGALVEVPRPARPRLVAEHDLEVQIGPARGQPRRCVGAGVREARREVGEVEMVQLVGRHDVFDRPERVQRRDERLVRRDRRVHEERTVREPAHRHARAHLDSVEAQRSPAGPERVFDEGRESAAPLDRAHPHRAHRRRGYFMKRTSSASRQRSGRKRAKKACARASLPTT